MNQIQLTGAVVAHSVLFLALCVACVYQSWKCIALYNLKETSVKMILMDATDERFPAISLNPGFRPDVLAQYGLSEEEYLSGKGWTSNNTPADEVYKMVTRDVYDVLETITLKYDDGRIMKPDFFMKTNNKRVSWSDNRGKSHVFHYEYPAGIRADEFPWGPGQGVEVMTSTFKNSTDFDTLTMSIQHAGRLLAPEIKDSTFKLERGKKTVATVRYSLILLMNKEDYPCVGVPEDEDNEFDECQQEHIIQELKKEVNCRVPWVLDPSLDVCDESLAKKASDIYFQAQKSPPCMQPCCTAEIDINNKFTTTTPDGSTELELRFPPTIKFYVEIEVYGLVSMLAELSGYIGMFLGISFFDMKIFLDMVIKYKSKHENTKQTVVAPFVAPMS